jgi:2-oxoglutarate dehydrogenase E2 component (dihydrolipoamide succinyltransferase)
MARYQLLLPKMGESVAEATIIKWNKNAGDYIEADEAVMEIATDKVDSEVPSPVSGKLIQQLCSENEVVQVGAVIAIIETEGGDEAEEIAAAAAEPQKSNIPEGTHDEPVISEPIPGLDQLEVKQTEESKGSGRFYSPLVKNIATQEGISIEELDKIPGTGAEGRLTKDDLLNYLQNPASVGKDVEPQPSSYTPPAQEVRQSKVEAPAYKAPEPVFEDKPFSVPATSASGRDEIIEMDRMRRLIADHMVMSKQTSPHVTSFVEADVTNLVLWREKIKGAFEKKEGEKITFTPIFIEAVVRAIKDMPMVNVSVNGYQIIKKADVNIGMATALPSGNLIVPVIKNADKLNLVGLTKSVNDLANRARNNKLQPDDVKDGTFTITNVGSFGNVMGTPIINQPQVAILAVGAIKKKPAVIETKQGDVIAIRHMMFLSLSYDHRVVDGALGGSFLRRVADYLEQWDMDRAI